MQIQRGRILIQRLFDIAEDINLPQAEKLVEALSRRPRFIGSARHIQLPSPPLEMNVGMRPLGVDVFPEHTTNPEVIVRIYDIGALVITFMLEIPNYLEAEILIHTSQRISEAEDAITQAALPIVAEIKTAIATACTFGDASDLTEECTIFCIQTTDPVCNADNLAQHLDIPRLLLGETEPIAHTERQHFLDASFSYRPDDLVVIDWNSALVLDPTGGVDVPELLELANIQLLELRVYDYLVEKSLDNLYKELGFEQKSIFKSNHYYKLSRRIMQQLIDITKITERIDNALTFLGDTWLARIHQAAVAEFGVPHWQQQLRTKLEVLRQINTLLINQITTQKSLTIEGAIVFLIIIEIMMAIYQLQ